MSGDSDFWYRVAWNIFVMLQGIIIYVTVCYIDKLIRKGK